MKLTYGAYQIELTIDSYEFPYDRYGDYHDNNWLNVHVRWEDDVIEEEGISSCLMTTELLELHKGLSQALLGTPYDSEFLEPDLEIHVHPKQEGIDVDIAYTRPGRNTLPFHAQITQDQLDRLISEVHELCIAFPERKNTMLN